MTDTVKTVEPEFDDQLLSALEKQLKAHNIRLKPEQSLASVAARFKENQTELGVSHGSLIATMGGSAVHVQESIEGLLRKEPDLFYPRETTGVTSRDQLDQKGKVQFIKEQGFDAFEKLPAKAPKETVVVLDRTKLNREEWLSLDRTTRAELMGKWGPTVVGQIMNRRKGK